MSNSIWRTALVCLLTAAALVLSSAAANAQQVTACATAPTAPDPSATVCISNVTVPFNGKSADNLLVVSWRTPNAERGQVKLADGEVFEDVRGADYTGRTHYVLVNNLNAKSTIQFDIVSGGATYTNDGAHWSARVGAAVQPPTPYTIFGRVKNPDGSEADGALVYAQLRDADGKDSQGRSALLSGLIVAADGGDFFNIDLSAARLPNNNQRYTFDSAADRVQLIAVNEQGTASKTFDIAALHPPQPPPSLLLAANGAGTAATATPTPIPPTYTPTLSPTPTATETPISPTATVTVPPTEIPIVEPTQEQVLEPSATPTFAPDTPTPAPTAAATQVAEAAGQEVEPERTRISRGVPDIAPPPPPANNAAWFMLFAVVLFVGAILLGLAAFFVSRR